MSDVSFSLSPEQRRLIEHAANLQGKNLADFVLNAAYERAQTVFLDQIFFKLDSDKFTHFMDLLDAPAGNNSCFDRLMSVKTPWSASDSS